MATVAERLLTEEEFLALPEDPEGRKLELLDGRVVRMSQPGEEHARIARKLFVTLFAFVEEHQFGEVFFDVGFKLRSSPDRIVNPDVAVVLAESLAPDRDVTKAIGGGPLLAVEVVSPNDRDNEVADKVLEYLDAGTRRVWVVRPTTRTITVHRPGGTAVTLAADASLTSEDAGFSVSGFAMPVAAAFPPPPQSRA
jgi:Uma2 family endonuclease